MFPRCPILRLIARGPIQKKTNRSQKNKCFFLSAGAMFLLSGLVLFECSCLFFLSAGDFFRPGSDGRGYLNESLILRLIAALYFDTRIIYLGIPAGPILRLTVSGFRILGPRMMRFWLFLNASFFLWVLVFGFFWVQVPVYVWVVWFFLSGCPWSLPPHIL